MQKPYDKVTHCKKPDWLKIKLPCDNRHTLVGGSIEKRRLHTICESGRCPNKSDCWSRHTATIMIMGDVCTRGCRFCATKTGSPLPLSSDEPIEVARSVRDMGLRHCVITSVTRDDLQDQGAAHWCRVVEAVRELNPQTTIELLIADMDARQELIEQIAATKPNIIGHNIETVERLTPIVRSRADYKTSLQTIRLIDRCGVRAKSGLMLGLGESHEEILRTLDDLLEAGCRIVTMGQYLQPTFSHYPVAEYIHPDKFEEYRLWALERGFSYVASAPLVRSSYMAEEALKSL